MTPTLTHSQAHGLESPLCHALDKPRSDFTREDLLRLIAEGHIERITFHYTALDGKYKELKLPVMSVAQAERVLAEGERVDGSSLFRGMVDAELSDLYVVPVYRSAFLNPFDDASLDFTCRYLKGDGDRVAFAPDNILHKASRLLTHYTGLELEALGELEFFLLSEAPHPQLYPAESQAHYHASAPFAKNGELLDEMVRLLAQITGAVKYGHAEVGVIDSVRSGVEEIRGRRAEQLEIEFLPMPIEDCGDALVLARWLVRNLAWRRGVVATFAPKLEDGVAGNGLHIHMQLTRDGRNVMTDGGGLSLEARQLIGGLCEYAPSLTAFGNTEAASYLRLVPNQEAPTRVCWSDMNRSAMIRVPLAWSNLSDLASLANPQQQGKFFHDPEARQTVELRTADGSALVHLLLAGIALGVAHGLTSDDSIETTARLHVGKDFRHDAERAAELPLLPNSCAESARLLLEKRALYEKEGVFPPSVIEYVERLLRAEDDAHVHQQLRRLDPGERAEHVRKIMHRHLHRH